MARATLPPRGGQQYPPGFWEEIADRAQSSPGLWVRGAESISGGMMSHIKTGKASAFNRAGGTFDAATRDNYWPSGEKRKGTRRGTLWVRWIPDGWTEADQAAAEEAAAQNTGEAEW